MILYRPTDGDPISYAVTCCPKTCFIMTQLGEPIPRIVKRIRSSLGKKFASIGYVIIDADNQTTGKDYLLNIWETVIGVPVGVAIISKEMPTRTIENIFYELGWMQAFGKETLIILADDVEIPSDLVRTQYVSYDKNFVRHIGSFISSLGKRAEYYLTMAEQLDQNPLLEIDYLRRAYLISGDGSIKQRVQVCGQAEHFQHRSKSSVEILWTKL